MKSYQTELHSAWLVGEITPKEIEALAAAGIEAVESHATQISIEQAREARRICDANGIKIHSVMRGANFNRDDLYKSDVEAMIRAIRVAAAYGASSILCVPGRVDAPPVSPDKFRFNSTPKRSNSKVSQKTTAIPLKSRNISPHRITRRKRLENACPRSLRSPRTKASGSDSRTFGTTSGARPSFTPPSFIPSTRPGSALTLI